MPAPATQSTAIAIVGGGPVGLVLALLLDRHGVKSTVFNTEPNARWHPKGNTHNARTMEHYRRLGIAEPIRRLGLPADHPTDTVYFTRFNGWELARIEMPSAAEKLATRDASAKTDQLLEPVHRANQMYVEKFLLGHAATRPNITLRFGWSATSFKQDYDGVSLRGERAGGEAESWRAAYLVGCDGGQSFVRRTLGIRYEGPGGLEQAFFGTYMLASYVRTKALYRDYKARRAWQYWVVNPELRVALTALNGKDEFLVLTRRAEDAPAPSAKDDALVGGMVKRAAGADIPVELLAHSPWNGGAALVAQRYGEDRVLMAGDAVHLFSPTGGFGMNTGIDDAANLAWKLAAMMQGWGGPDLIASYDRERRPVGMRNTEAARALSMNVGDVKTPREMEEESPAGTEARRQASDFLATFGEEFGSIGVQLGARYDGSSLVTPDGAPPPEDFAHYDPSGVPGGRAPQLWLDAGRDFGSSLFDRFGVGFTLLRLGRAPPDSASLAAAAQSRGIPLQVLDIADTEARALYGRDLALIRPDQHVAWRGDRAPPDADGLWARLVGF